MHRQKIMPAGVGSVVAVAIAFAGSLSVDASAPPSSTPPTAASSTAATSSDPASDAVADPGLVRLGDLLSVEDGRLPVDDALAIFAALIAPLPGIEPTVDADQLPSGTASMAIRRLVAARDTLPPDVIAAVDAALEPQPGDIEAVIDPGDVAGPTTSGLSPTPRRGPSIGSFPATTPTAGEPGALIAEYVGEFTRLSGHELSTPIRARIVGAGRIGGDEGNTTGIGPLSDPTGCRLLLNASLFTSGLSAEHVTSTALHEVWHCFQLDANAATYENGPEWIIEGQAEWAGEEPVGGSAASASVWDTWLLSPERSLYRRSYDAIGIYAVAASSGADPFRTMLPMLGQNNAAAVGTLFGADASAAVLATASALVRAPERGPEWESFGPGITGGQGAAVMAIPDGAPATVQRTVGRFATLPVVLTVTAGDIARVTLVGGTAGAVELPGTDVIALAPGGTASFCLRPDGCLCPDGSPPGGGEPLPAASPGEGAAAIGTLDGGDLAVTAVKLTLEESCQTIVGTWTTTFAAVLAVGTAPYGGMPTMVCDGPYVVTYAADGTFSGGANATCTLDDMSSLMEMTFTGTYTADGTTLQVSSFAARGTVTANGITMDAPFPPGGINQGDGTYTIVGNTLTVTFANPDGHVLTLSMTRSA